jgi:hypothetical protein
MPHGRVLRTNRRKVVFSGAAHHAYEAAGAGYFADSSGESAETGLGGGEGRIRTSETLKNSTGGIRPEFGPLLGSNKSIRAVESLLALDSALFRISPVPFVP